MKDIRGLFLRANDGDSVVTIDPGWVDNDGKIVRLDEPSEIDLRKTGLGGLDRLLDGSQQIYVLLVSNGSAVAVIGSPHAIDHAILPDGWQIERIIGSFLRKDNGTVLGFQPSQIFEVHARPT